MFTISTRIRANKIPNASAYVRSAVENLVKFTGDEMLDTAKALVPVRTGYLKSTISAHLTQWQAEVGAEAPYAGYVELGTWKMAAQPYLRPAFELHAPFFKEEMARIINALGAM